MSRRKRKNAKPIRRKKPRKQRKQIKQRKNINIASCLKKYILPNLPYIAIGWFCNKASEACQLVQSKGKAAYRILEAMQNLNDAMSNPIPSFYHIDLLAGLIGAACFYGIVWHKTKTAKKWRHDVEYGSARWGSPKDIEPYADQNPDNNVILTATESLTMNSRPKQPKYARNKNVMIIGGSGSGKTRYFVKPNIMQCVSKDYPVSFVCTDPKGSLVYETAHLLKRKGYKIKILNTIDFKSSMRFNPFCYLKSQSDILKLVTALMENTQDNEQKGGDPFWQKAESLLYQALIAYIFYERPKNEHNMNTLVGFINSMKVSENDESKKNAVDVMFDELEQEKPDCFAVRQYAKFSLAAGKTLKSILVMCGARLSTFDIEEVRDLMSDDELELDLVGDEKTALFVVVSDTDDSFVRPDRAFCAVV